MQTKSSLLRKIYTAIHENLALGQEMKGNLQVKLDSSHVVIIDITKRKKSKGYRHEMEASRYLIFMQPFDRF